MDFKIYQAADLDLMRRHPIHYKWMKKGEDMPDEKQTCFGCQHSHNMGAPNLDSLICMDDCRRGSAFTPFNGDEKAIALKKEAAAINAEVNFIIGTGFCMGDSEYEKCLDCYSMRECQLMLYDDNKRAAELSLNPKTQGSTLPPGSFVEMEGTVFKGIGRRECYDINPSSAPNLEGIPGDMNACAMCNDRHVAQTIMDQDMKRAMLSVDTPIILKANATEIVAMRDEFEAKAEEDGCCGACDSRSLIGPDHPQSPHNTPKEDDGVLRSFDSGATRDTGGNKLCYDKFLSPGVIKQFAKYMNMNRLQSDGKLRDGDNWQKGIPMEVYVESEGRHHHEAWEFFRQINLRDRDGMVEGVGAMCGILFNVMGWLHEWLKANPMIDFDGEEPTFEMKERQDALKEISETEDA